MNFSPFVSYTNEYGLPAVKVRQWHPAIFVPNFMRWLRYWSGAWGRYREYEKELREMYKLCLREGFITGRLQFMNCGYECSWTDPYGFVPEDGCPIHNV